jgi:hypothetical protein
MGRPQLCTRERAGIKDGKRQQLLCKGSSCDPENMQAMLNHPFSAKKRLLGVDMQAVLKALGLRAQ